MTIRSKVTLWYVGLLLVSLAAMAGVLHYEWTENLRQILEHKTEPDSAWEETGEVVLYYGVPTAVFLLVGGWLVMRKSLAPVATLTNAIERIHGQNLKERLPTKRQSDELDRLTEVFNAMMNRIEESFDHIREFTLHASHELKTPLTIMRAETELALREKAPDYRDLLASHLEEIQRLTQIVDGLTLLAKADAGQIMLKRTPLGLKELVEDSFTDAQMLAKDRRVEVRLANCEEVVVLGDRNRLKQLLLNLTDNAIKYNQPQGNVTIGLGRQNGSAELRITNTGPGIPLEKLPRVFDRFFRVVPAQSNPAEGCGLGLTIAQWIVQAHGGTIQLESKPGGPTTATVKLPEAPSSGGGLTEKGL